MELKETVDLMLSEDYKERFKAEYYQLEIRIQKLQHMVDNWDNLKFTPTCRKGIYRKQIFAMTDYLNVLKERAKIEEIEL